MLTGLPARQLQADLKKYSNKPQYGFLPSDLDSLTPPPAGEAAFVIGPHPTSVNRLASARVAVTWGGAPSIRLTESLIQETWGKAPCVNDTDAGDHRDCVPEPPPATPGDYLDNLSFHLMYRLAYRNFGGNPVQESLVGNVTVKGGNSKPDHGAIRWYKFRNAGSSTTTPTVFQASTYDPDNAYRWMGSIAMDKDHNIALGYSKSSLSVKPSIFITGRLSTDPINTLGAEAQVQAGTGVQQAGGNRWGDYSAMTLDPVDQCTFYYTNEYLRRTASSIGLPASRRTDFHPVLLPQRGEHLPEPYFFTKQRPALWRHRYFEQWICRRDQLERCLLVFGSARNLHRNGCRRRPQLHVGLASLA